MQSLRDQADAINRPEFMARRGKGKQLNSSVSQSEFTRIHQSATIYAPFPTKKGEKPIDYDTRPAKTVLETMR